MSILALLCLIIIKNYGAIHITFFIFILFVLTQSSHKLPETIERETFQQHNRRINNPYKRTVRALVFILKNQEDVRNKVLSGEITVTNFVKENKKSL